MSELEDGTEFLGAVFCALFFVAVIVCTQMTLANHSAIDNLENDYKQSHYERALKESGYDRAKTEKLLADELQEIKDRD